MKIADNNNNNYNINYYVPFMSVFYDKNLKCCVFFRFSGLDLKNIVLL